MTGYKDGFRRGTNWCYRSRMANYDPRAEMALGIALGNACARGEHDETVAEKTQVTHLPGIGRVEPGTRYCARCGKVLTDETSPVTALSKRPHCCDEACVCPVHGTPLIYWPAGDDHACQDVDCKFGHGMGGR